MLPDGWKLGKVFKDQTRLEEAQINLVEHQAAQHSWLDSNAGLCHVDILALVQLLLRLFSFSSHFHVLK